MMFRGAEQELPPAARDGLHRFEAFLESYADLASALNFDVHGMTQSPFTVVTPRFDSDEDARRKAEEVRAQLRLGLGPIGDVDRVCDLLGICVLLAPLGATSGRRSRVRSSPIRGSGSPSSSTLR